MVPLLGWESNVGQNLSGRSSSHLCSKETKVLKYGSMLTFFHTIGVQSQRCTERLSALAIEDSAMNFVLLLLVHYFSNSEQVGW